MSVDAFAATTSTLGDRGSHAITGLCESLGIVLTQAALVRARLVLSNNDGLLISV